MTGLELDQKMCRLGGGTDREQAHIEADKLMATAVRELAKGRDDAVLWITAANIFDGMVKWTA